MNLDTNRASLALCHAKAIIELVIDQTSSEKTDLALSAALEFVESAKAMIDGIDRRQPEAQS